MVPPLEVVMAPTPIVADPLIFFFYGVLSPLMDDKAPLVLIGTCSVLAPEISPEPGTDAPPAFDVERRLPVPPLLGFVEIVPNPPPAFLPLRVKGFIFPR